MTDSNPTCYYIVPFLFYFLLDDSMKVSTLCAMTRKRASSMSGIIKKGTKSRASQWINVFICNTAVFGILFIVQAGKGEEEIIFIEKVF